MFRTGWDADAGLVLFRAGPTFNHNHSDQGSFQFRALGETLVTEAGWSDYYKDPYYDTFFTQAAGHNTASGRRQSGESGHRRHGTIRRPQPASPDHRRDVEPVLRRGRQRSAPVYAAGSRATRGGSRTSKPDYLIVFDRVRAKAQPASLAWRLHVASKSGLTVTQTGRLATATYVGARAAMTVRAFSSVKTRFMAGDGHIPYPVFSARTPATVPPQPAYLDLITAEPADHAWVMLALVPGKNIEAANASAAKLLPLAAPGWSGLRTEQKGARDVVLFRTDTAPPQTQFENWRTDAEAMTYTTVGAELRRFGAQRVRDLRHNDRQLIAADRP